MDQNAEPHISLAFQRALLGVIIAGMVAGWVLGRTYGDDGFVVFVAAAILGASFWGRRFALIAGAVTFAALLPNVVLGFGLAGLVIVLGERTNQLRSRVGRFAERSFTDRLTGLFNYDFLQAQVRFELDRLRRYGGSASLIVIDLDNFKNFNDTYGHQAGNLLLIETAQAIRRAKRDSDFAARFGGEELVVLVPGAAEDAMRLAERIRTQIAMIRLAHLGPDVGVTASFGIASFPTDAGNAADLFECADRALYVAKETGKNRTIVYPNTLVRTRPTASIGDATPPAGPGRGAAGIAHQHADPPSTPTPTPRR